MFRASTCPSSGGQILLSQHLVSSLSVNGCTVCRKRADWKNELCIKVGKWNKSILWCTVRKHQHKWFCSQYKENLLGDFKILRHGSLDPSLKWRLKRSQVEQKHSQAILHSLGRCVTYATWELQWTQWNRIFLPVCRFLAGPSVRAF
jgi:hypothetical protein